MLFISKNLLLFVRSDIISSGTVILAFGGFIDPSLNIIVPAK
jgi:hypothetical protein